MWCDNEIVYCDCEQKFISISGIGQHLLEDKECAKHYNVAHFLFGHSKTIVLFIIPESYLHQLRILSRQKEFVYSLQISQHR